MNSRSGRSSSSKSAAATAANLESEKRSKELRAIQQSDAANKSCLDCGQRGPTYVDMTVGSFVCTKCSGMLRGINPPHRIKSLSMSSFTAEEVAMMRAKGNTWAKKVYLGLYDENRSAYDLKDGESVRDFIIEKYEKKRYYVDPSSIVHTPSSQSSGANAAGNRSAGGDARTSNLIGATLNARLASSSSSHGTSAASSTSASSAGTASSSSSAVGAISAPPANSTSISRPTGSNSQQLLADLVAPPAAAVVTADPFKPLQTPPVSSATPPSLARPSATSTSTSSSSSKPSSDAFANFANFDTATFDPPSENTFASPSPMPQPHTMQPTSHVMSATKLNSSNNSASKPMAIGGNNRQKQEEQDKYAALKDLDEIFKTSATVQEATSTAQSTGVSIFGTSPLQATGVTGVQPGVAAAAAVAASGNSRGATATPTDAFDNIFGAANPTATSGFGASAGVAGGASGGPDQWANWKERNGASAAKSPPVNPFTGASNLTQLNTSPWPTTGNSPVNTGNNSSSVNNSNAFALGGGGASAAQSQWKAFGDMGSNQTEQADPFNTANINSEPCKKADLFAKAPKPTPTAEDNSNSNTNGSGQFSTDFAANFTDQQQPNKSNSAANFEAFFDTMANTAGTNNGSNNNPWPAAAPAAATAATNNKNPFL